MIHVALLSLSAQCPQAAPRLWRGCGCLPPGSVNAWRSPARRPPQLQNAVANWPSSRAADSNRKRTSRSNASRPTSPSATTNSRPRSSNGASAAQQARSSRLPTRSVACNWRCCLLATRCLARLRRSWRGSSPCRPRLRLCGLRRSGSSAIPKRLPVCPHYGPALTSSLASPARVRLSGLPTKLSMCWLPWKRCPPADLRWPRQMPFVRLRAGRLTKIW